MVSYTYWDSDYNLYLYVDGGRGNFSISLKLGYLTTYEDGTLIFMQISPFGHTKHKPHFLKASTLSAARVEANKIVEDNLLLLPLDRP